MVNVAVSKRTTVFTGLPLPKTIANDDRTNVGIKIRFFIFMSFNTLIRQETPTLLLSSILYRNHLQAHTTQTTTSMKNMKASWTPDLQIYSKGYLSGQIFLPQFVPISGYFLKSLANNVRFK